MRILRHTVILVSILGQLLAPLCALGGVVLNAGMLPFLVAYFVFGAVGDVWSTTLNYLLELVHQSGESETDAITLMNVASVPALLLPLIASVLTHWLGLAAPFLGATAMVGLAFVLVCGLPETRRGVSR